MTRLLIHGIETPLLYKKGTKGSDSLSSARERAVDWPQRIENHCKYLVTERLHSKEVYELWLRTSAAAYQVLVCYALLENYHHSRGRSDNIAPENCIMHRAEYR